MAYPQINWIDFVKPLKRYPQRTRSEPDNHSDFRLQQSNGHLRQCSSTILIDFFSRYKWTYVNDGIFQAKSKAIGSSAMPHKSQHVGFENAEGKQGLANISSDTCHQASSSRLQRGWPALPPCCPTWRTHHSHIYRAQVARV